VGDISTNAHGDISTMPTRRSPSTVGPRQQSRSAVRSLRSISSCLWTAFLALAGRNTGTLAGFRPLLGVNLYTAVRCKPGQQPKLG
jgi:hypothetical protein